VFSFLPTFVVTTDIFLFIIIAWLLGLTAVLVWIVYFFKRLTKSVKRGNLVRILDRVIKKEAENTKNVRNIYREIERIDAEGFYNFKKIGLVKFNPFKELGGDHSFAIALLDGVGSGFVLTGLHTRERTRIYLRKIIKGKSEHKLSAEEEKALIKALKK
jgi:hypothetical protein